jgi:hypothetical protein
MSKSNLVTCEEERRWTFYIPIDDNAGQYFNVGDDIWRHDSRLTEADEEIKGRSVFISDILGDIVGQFFGFKNNLCIDKETCLIETTEYSDFMITLNADTCPYTKKSLLEAFQKLGDHANSFGDFHGNAKEFEMLDEVKSLLVEKRRAASK